jgi:hypothetical protein
VYAILYVGNLEGNVGADNLPPLGGDGGRTHFTTRPTPTTTPRGGGPQVLYCSQGPPAPVGSRPNFLHNSIANDGTKDLIDLLRRKMAAVFSFVENRLGKWNIIFTRTKSNICYDTNPLYCVRRTVCSISNHWSKILFVCYFIANIHFFLVFFLFLALQYLIFNIWRLRLSEYYFSWKHCSIELFVNNFETPKTYYCIYNSRF